jgi:hypothetical protein
MEENKVLAQWEELKVLVDSLEFDVVKNANGTAAAGIRARKGLRLLKTKLSELVKTMVVLDKEHKAAKKSAKSA